jgi:hypothetical protein
MASGATSMLRDFGLTLGPAIVGAIALTNAANAIAGKLAGDAALQQKVDALPAELKGVVGSGPLGANAIPNPPNPLKDVAFHALSHAYSIGYLVCGIAALLAAVIAAVMLGGRQHTESFVAAAEASAPQ